MEILNKNFIDYIDYIKLENYRNKKIGTSGLNLTQNDVLKKVKVEISYAFNLEKIIKDALNNTKNRKY